MVQCRGNLKSYEKCFRLLLFEPNFQYDILFITHRPLVNGTTSNYRPPISNCSYLLILVKKANNNNYDFHYFSHLSILLTFMPNILKHKSISFSLKGNGLCIGLSSFHGDFA